MASPLCTVRDGAGSPVDAADGAVEVTATNTVTIALISTAGVNLWSLSVVGQDELISAPTVTVNQTNKTATFTAPTAPWSLIFQSKINNGKNTNQQTDSTYTTTFKIVAATSDGLHLASTNETLEENPSFGWVGLINDAIRAASGAGGAVPDTRTVTAGSGLSGGGTLAANRTFDVNVDGSTIEINADTLRVKDAGITPAKISNRTALSLFGNSSNASAVGEDIAAGSDKQVMRRSGTAIGFGSIDLASSSVVGSSILPVANGGTGSSAAAVVVGTYAATVGALSPAGNRLAFCTDGGISLWGDNGSLWYPSVGGITCTKVPAAAAFTDVNGSGVTATDSKGTLVLQLTNEAGLDAHPFVKSKVSVVSVEAAAMSSNTTIDGSTNRYVAWGAVLRESATGKFAHILCQTHLDSGTGPFGTHFNFGYFSNLTTRVSSNDRFLPGIDAGNIFLRIRISAGNLVYEWSKDNNNWSQLINPSAGAAPIAVTTAFTTAPNQSGVVILGTPGTEVVNKAAFYHFLDT